MVTERCGGAGRRAYSYVLIECEPLPTGDEGQGRSFAPLRINSGKFFFIQYTVINNNPVNDNYPSPRAVPRVHKRRPIRVGGSLRLCLTMCEKKVDNCNKPVILCISQQNTQWKYNRNFTT